MFKTCTARGLNFNVIICVLARQPEKNGRKGIQRMILVEARSLYMINVHLDNTDAPVLV